MNEQKIFDSIENSSWFNQSGEEICSYSAICDDDGSFEIHCKGNFGTKGLRTLINDLMDICNKGGE